MSCLNVFTFYLVLFEQVGYSIFLVQYRKVFSDQYNFFERVEGRSNFCVALRVLCTEEDGWNISAVY